MSIKKLIKRKKEEDRDDDRRAEDPPPPPPEDGESLWLVSYADMMTLLCGFFIMMFSMAKLDEPQYEKVKEAVAKQFGGDYKSPTKDLAKFVTQVLHEAGLESQTMVRADPAGVSVVFFSTVFFDTLSSEIRPAGRIIMNKLIDAIAGRQDMELKKYKIVVEGHTDSRPIVSGVFPSNWELSSARAARVVRMFLDRGFDSKRLTAIGYADTYPAEDAGSGRSPDGNWNEAALGKNRRVVIRILEPKVDYIPFPDSTNDGDKALTAASSTH